MGVVLEPVQNFNEHALIELKVLNEFEQALSFHPILFIYDFTETACHGHCGIIIVTVMFVRFGKHRYIVEAKFHLTRRVIENHRRQTGTIRCGRNN